ncbi:hypothetical protein HMPREF0189_01925 [Burkholderiales bacterium 1_1_47]|nr:hypothetical protein HMPREF0189_01925 [Burkholderiales bacterium 1_1_47]
MSIVLKLLELYFLFLRVLWKFSRCKISQYPQNPLAIFFNDMRVEWPTFLAT